MTPHHRVRGAGRTALVCLLLAITSCSSSGPTDVPARGAPDAPPKAAITSLVFSGGGTSVVVHQMALLSVAGLTADGVVVPLPAPILWDTSDDAIASISPEGVITAHERGSVTIGASWGALRAELVVRVMARVRITPSYTARGCGSCGPDRRITSNAWPLQIGDTLDLTAIYVDVDGLPLGPAASVVWTSSDSSAVTVSQSGRVIPLLPNSSAEIQASAEDGADAQHVRVWDAAPGTATLRLAHAAGGRGPLTFVHNKGDPVILEFGESVDLSISAGPFFVDVEDGAPGESRPPESAGLAAINRDGDRLSIYVVLACCEAVAVAPTARVSLVAGWDDRPPVPSDSVRIRLIQGSPSIRVVYVLPRGAPAMGLPTLCYFDPGDMWGYRSLAAGLFDVVLQTKYAATFASTRVEVDLEAGRSATFVLTEGPGQAPGIVGFEDP